MSRSSYLGRLARRAGPNPPGLAPPRPISRAFPFTSPEGETLLAQPPEVTAPVPPAPRRLAMRPEPAAPPATEPSAPLAVPAAALPGDLPPVADPPAGQNHQPPAVPDVARPDGPRPMRPPADFVFDAPGQGARSPRPQLDDGVSVNGMTVARPGPQATTEAVAAPRPGSAGRRPADPDPVAVLAAAVRWTSSDTTPAQSPAPAQEPAVAWPASRAEHVAIMRPATERQPEAELTTANPPRRPPRFTDVHIGLIEVEVVAPPEPGQPGQPEKPAAATVTSRDFGVPIARKVTSYYGLNQR